MELSTNVSSIWLDNKKRYISISDINGNPSAKEDRKFDEEFGIPLSEFLQGIKRLRKWDREGCCLRRNYFAVGFNVKDETWDIQYTHAPKGEESCKDIGKCKREELNIPQGQRYELCRSIHAEQGLMMNMSINERFHSVMILAGKDAKTGEYIDAYPCVMCKRIIKDSLFKYLFCQTAKENVFEIIDIDNWK